MSTRTIPITDEIHAYLMCVTVDEPPLLTRLRAETARLPDGRMQISPEQGRFMRLLLQMIGARRAIELGTFTGYSSICIAGELPADGRLICCDLSADWTSIARKYWQEAGLTARIELRLGDALQTLDALIADGGAGQFCFVFIDADKPRVLDYYERALTLLRPGGLIAVDNALRGGKVADATIDDEYNRAMRAVNHRATNDPRVTSSLVTIGDGLLLARKK